MQRDVRSLQGRATIQNYLDKLGKAHEISKS